MFRNGLGLHLTLSYHPFVLFAENRGLSFVTIVYRRWLGCKRLFAVVVAVLQRVSMFIVFGVGERLYL